MTRVARLAKLIREELSEILRDEVSDPRIGCVSIRAVDLCPDMKNAKIYMSILGSEKEKNEAMEGLASATGFIRTKLAQLLKNRSTPELRFIQDDSIERGSKVLGIISKLEHENEGISRDKKGPKKV